MRSYIQTYRPQLWCIIMALHGVGIQILSNALFLQGSWRCVSVQKLFRSTNSPGDATVVTYCCNILVIYIYKRDRSGKRMDIYGKMTHKLFWQQNSIQNITFAKCIVSYTIKCQSVIFHLQNKRLQASSLYKHVHSANVMYATCLRGTSINICFNYVTFVKAYHWLKWRLVFR